MLGDRIDFTTHIQSFEDVIKQNASIIDEYNKAVEQKLITAIKGKENLNDIKESLVPVLAELKEKRYLLWL